MWPFKNRNLIVQTWRQPMQKLPDEVLDKLLLMIKTGIIVQRYDIRNGDHVVVDGKVDVTTCDGIMTIKIRDEEVCLRRRFDADYTLICDALNVRIKELKVIATVDRDYSGFNKEVSGL